jgi:hypothetical protein
MDQGQADRNKDKDDQGKMDAESQLRDGKGAEERGGGTSRHE